VNLGGRPAVVAHRGDSAHFRENTLRAFDTAVEAGADIVEFDVRRTADGRLVVVHDATLGPPGSAEVSNLKLAEVRELQPQIPTLEATLELLRGRVVLEVEIKNIPGEAGYEPYARTIARDVVAALQRHRFTDAFIASFDHECLCSVRELDPGVATGFLLDSTGDLERALELAAGSHTFLLPEATTLERAGAEFIRRARRQAVCICAWTVDDPEAMRRLLELGVDAFETNDPALGVAVRDRFLRS
jgi:glycerophosphoryl diester phosphodiesterase